MNTTLPRDTKGQFTIRSIRMSSCMLATYKLVAFNPATGDVQAFETMALRADDAIADVEGMFGVQVRECWKVGV